jgi:hypothetical protein
MNGLPKGLMKMFIVNWILEEMNDVEKFYEAARLKFPGSRPWNQLDPMEQIQIVQAINLILGVLTR